MKILLTISYDGSNYCGWQRQKNAISIQEKIEEALSALYKQNVVITGASRTDANVHAYGQKASFTVIDNKILLEKLPKVINGFLPKDIVITKAELASSLFHPQYDAKKKTYIYKISNSQYADPLKINQEWHVPLPLDFEKMVNGGMYFLGEHDFKGFCSANSQVKTTIRTIYQMEILKNNEEITIKVCGNGFLYNMVRIIVGTLVYVGMDRIAPEDIQNIIVSKKRELAGKTAPPQGLYLKEIFY